MPPRLRPIRRQPAKQTIVSRPLLLGLLTLLAGVTLIGAWNESRQPRASFTVTDQDLPIDPLATATPLSPDQASPSPLASAAAGDDATPAPGPTPQPLVRIKGRDVNIRKLPSRQAPVVAKSRPEALYHLGGATTRAEGIDWVQIELEDGTLAWVSADFVAAEDALTAAAGSASPIPAPATGQDRGTLIEGEASSDEVETAARLVEQLLLAPGTVWPKTDPTLRALTTQAMVRRIFKDRPTSITREHPPTLDACMQKSAVSENLKTLKVYELAVACSLALGWR